MQQKYEYGEILRLLKIANDIDLKELAASANCSYGYICMIMSSNRRPSFTTFEKLLEFLGFTMYDFMVVAEYRFGLGTEISDLRKYQLTLLKILTILIEKRQQNSENVLVL